MRVMRSHRAVRIGATAAAVLSAAMLLSPLPSPAAAAAADPSWTVELSGPGADAVNVRRGTGLTIADLGERAARTPGVASATVLTVPHRPGRPVSGVRAALDATVPSGAGIAIELRGRRDGGGWTEWREATGGTTTLPTASDAVQARLTLTATGSAGPTVRGLRLTATPAAGAQAGAPAAGAQVSHRLRPKPRAPTGSTPPARAWSVRPRRTAM